jgi:hypothetical protein
MYSNPSNALECSMDRYGWIEFFPLLPRCVYLFSSPPFDHFPPLTSYGSYLGYLHNSGDIQCDN